MLATDDQFHGAVRPQACVVVELIIKAQRRGPRPGVRQGTIMSRVYRGREQVARAVGAG